MMAQVTQPMLVQPQQPVMMQPGMQQPMMMAAPAMPAPAMPMANASNNVQNSTNIVIGGTDRTVMNKDWKFSLCACCNDIGACLCVLCLPCAVAVLASKMNENLCLPFICSPVITLAALRMKIRYLSNYKGSIFDDLSTSCCCYPCVMCQVWQEWNYLIRSQQLK